MPGKALRRIGLGILILFVGGISVLFFILINPVWAAGKDSVLSAVKPDSVRLRKDVQWLCHFPKPRNSRNLQTLDSAAEFIYSRFSSFSQRVWRQKYNADGKSYQNLIASFGPEAGPRIIVGAHYDVCAEQAGADDNASGVAGLLELARLLDSLKPVLKYRIDLVAYTLEEPPYFRTQYMGSAVHAASLKDSNINVRAMLCLEMIGYFSDEPGSQDYPAGILKLFYPKRGNFIAVVGKLGQGQLIRQVKRGMRRSSPIEVRSINAPAWIPGIDFSDHLNYWAMGYDAAMITNTAFYRNKNYHEPTDIPSTLNYGKMAEVVQGVYGVVVSLP